MRIGMLQACLKVIVAVTLAVLLVMPVYVVSAAPANPGGTDFEIPISELNKVKKKTPSKHATKEKEPKKKKSAAKTAKSSPEKIVHAEPAGPDKGTAAAAVEPSANPEDTRIHHSPYSFVVVGKPTVIHTVINSKTDIQEVNCTFPKPEGGGQTTVKMTKVAGTKFTYTATLPALPAESSALRYSIVVVDSLSKETRSNEYVSPVSVSPVVPSWQNETTGEALAPDPKEPKKPTEVPSDPVPPKKESATP